MTTAVRYRPRTTADRVAVTVVVTCFNYAHFLEDSVRSALDQAGVEVAVIVVDDASTDTSLAVANRMASEDSRVSVIANQSNLGAVGAFNRGLEAASSEFLVRLDADDLLTPGALKRAADAFRAFPSVGLVYGHPIHFHSGRPLPRPRQTPTWWQVWRGWDWLASRCMDGTNAITSPEVMLRKSVLDRVGGMRYLAHTHDYELWLRVATTSDVAYLGGVDQAWHREHAASLSTTAGDSVTELSELRDAFTTLFSSLPATSPAISTLPAQAARAVATAALVEAQRVLDRRLDTATAATLVSLATATDSTVSDTAQWRRVQRVMHSRVPHWIRWTAAGASRLQRRARARIRAYRWRTIGVHEPLRLIGALHPLRSPTFSGPPRAADV